MNASPADVRPFPSQPPLLFTLGSALGWLGHDCSQACSTSIAHLGADIWFTRVSRRPLWMTPQGTVVVVDQTAGSADNAEVSALITAVDACTRTDGIRVRRRHVANEPTAQMVALADAALDPRAEPDFAPAAQPRVSSDASTWVRIDRDGSPHWGWAATGQAAPLTRIRPRARRP